jgi:DNA polymerase-3 subunit epsilon
MRNLILEGPLVVFDLETTGTKAGVDRITQIAAIKYWPDGHVEELCTTINPLMEVKKFILELTHLTQEQLDNSHPFSAWAEYVYYYFTSAVHPTAGVQYPRVDYCGYNSNRFDIPFLQAEFDRVNYTWDTEGSCCIDAYQIFAKMAPRDLGAAYWKYCNKELEGAHDALVDTKATFEVLMGQIQMYEEMPADVCGISEFCKKEGWVDTLGKFIWEEGRVVLNFSEHQGKSLPHMAQCEPGFLRWMLKKDFSAEAKKIARDALEGVFPVKPS